MPQIFFFEASPANLRVANSRYPGQARPTHHVAKVKPARQAASDPLVQPTATVRQTNLAEERAATVLSKDESERVLGVETLIGMVRSMVERGLSERRALTVVGMGASSLRYMPAPDRNADLRARIVALALRHRPYGAGMIHLKLRQAGDGANHKRVHRRMSQSACRFAAVAVRRRRWPIASR